MKELVEDKHNCVKDKETMCKEQMKILREAMAAWTKKVDGFWSTMT